MNASENLVVNFPFGAIDTQSPAYAATLAVTIKNQGTILIPGTMTGAMTINLTINADINAGARLSIQLTSDGTARTVTFGTGFTAVALAGTISKTNKIEFEYDGTTFKQSGAAVLIN